MSLFRCLVWLVLAIAIFVTGHTPAFWCSGLMAVALSWHAFKEITR